MSAHVSRSFLFHEKICRVLGLDPARTKNISIELDGALHFPLVRCEMLLEVEDGEGIIEELREYELVPKGQAEVNV